MDPAADDLLVGRTVGGYRIVARMARGGLSVVYRAENERGEQVAVKVLDPLYASLSTLRQRFAREAEVAERLAGQGAPALVGDGEIDGGPYLLFELVDGDRLADRMAAGRVPVRSALAITMDLLRALAPAHRLGIVHLDVKPANVMLARAGGVRLLDFSSLPLSPDGRYPGVESEPLGTPAYCSPEQVDGRAFDARADLYAVGVVLFELLSAQRPFHGDPVEVLRGHAERPPTPLWQLAPDLSPALVELVHRALAKDPAERFADAGTMIAALRAVPEAAGM